MKSCCGGPARTEGRTTRTRHARVRYAGERPIRLVSTLTMRAYRFSAEARVQSVDERDLPLFLRRATFRRLP